MTTAAPIDPFAGSDSTPSVKWEKVGTVRTLTIDGDYESFQSRKFGTKELDYWPDGNPKYTISFPVLTETGDREAIYAGKPSSLLSAIIDAVKASGAKKSEAGGVLTIQWSGEEPSGKGNPKKVFKAKYAAPAAKPAVDPFADDQPPF